MSRKWYILFLENVTEMLEKCHRKFQTDDKNLEFAAGTSWLVWKAHLLGKIPQFSVFLSLSFSFVHFFFGGGGQLLVNRHQHPSTHHSSLKGIALIRSASSLTEQSCIVFYDEDFAYQRVVSQMSEVYTTVWGLCLSPPNYNKLRRWLAGHNNYFLNCFISRRASLKKVCY